VINETKDHVTAIDRETRQYVQRFGERFCSQPHRRIIVSTYPLREALKCPRIGQCVHDVLLVSYASIGDFDNKRQCFVCCLRWTKHRAPVGVLEVAPIGMDEAIIALICHKCWTADGAREAFAMALRRDFGAKLQSMRRVCESPTITAQ
jgi:hypothetical protein